MPSNKIKEVKQKADEHLLEKIKEHFDAWKAKKEKLELKNLSLEKKEQIKKIIALKNIPDLFFTIKAYKENEAQSIIHDFGEKKNQEIYQFLLPFLPDTLSKESFLQNLKKEMESNAKGKLDDIHKLMSDLRKKSQNLFFEEMIFSRLMLKIKLVLATESRKDWLTWLNQYQKLEKTIRNLHNKIIKE